MNMTDYLEEALLNHVLTVANWPMPSGLWLSLHTEDPTEAGLHSGEVGGPVGTTGYERYELTSVMSAADPESGQSANTSTIIFGPALTDWGLISYAGIEQEATQTTLDMLFWAQGSVTRNLSTGQSMTLAVGQVALRFQ